MKIGLRKPSIKKSISARTTGKAKRTVKKPVRAHGLKNLFLRFFFHKNHIIEMENIKWQKFV